MDDVVARAAVALYSKEKRPATEDEIQNLIERAATGKAKLEVTREQVKEYWATGVEVTVIWHSYSRRKTHFVQACCHLYYQL